MHRVFFDSNSGNPASGGYGLWFEKSLTDLAAIPGGPREGMRVIIYMEDVEMEAMLTFDSGSKSWIGIPLAAIGP